MTAKEKARDKYLQKTYGITLEQYNQKLASQNDCCELCGKHKSNSKRPLHQDHCHKTGKNRGILCYFCNRRRVGRLTLEWSKKIYNYLLKYDGAA